MSHPSPTVARRTALALAAGCTVLVAGARAGAAPAGIYGPGHTALAVVNLDAVQAAVAIADFYPQSSGGVAPVSIARPSVPPGGVVVLTDEPELTDGLYSAIVSSDRSIDTRAITDWSSSGAAIASESAEVGNEVLVPLAMIAYHGQSSLLAIHNTDTGQVAVATIALFARESATPVVTKAFQIGPGTGITLNLQFDAAFAFVQPNTPDGFIGSMRVSSAVAVGVTAIQNVETSERAAYSHVGVPRDNAGMRLHVPLVIHGAARDVDHVERTLIAVQNAGAAFGNVVVTYDGFAGPCAGRSLTVGPRAVAPLAMTLFDTLTDTAGTALDQPPSGLPDGCVATARIEADGPVAATVVHTRAAAGGPDGPMTAAAANAFPGPDAATDWVAWPWDRAGAPSGAESEAIVYNPGDGPAAVTLSPRSGDGRPTADCGAPCVATVEAGETAVLRSADAVTMAATFSGTALIRSDRPVMVWVRTTAPDGFRDDTLAAGVPVRTASKPDIQSVSDLRRRFQPIVWKNDRPAPTATLRPSPSPWPTSPPTPSPTLTPPPEPTTTVPSPTPDGTPAAPTEPASGLTATPTELPTDPATTPATATPSSPPTATPPPPHGRTAYLPWARTDAGPAHLFDAGPARRYHPVP